MSKNKSKKSVIQKTAELIFSVSLIAIVVIGLKYVSVNTKEISEVSFVTESTTTTEVDKNLGFKKISKPNNDVYFGELILVNKEHLYDIKDSESLNLTSVISKSNSSYGVRDSSVYLNTYMVDELNLMFTDFEANTGLKTIMCNSGYRSIEEQRLMYEDDLAVNGTDTSTLVAPPGGSEHHTGYAIDLAIYENSVTAFKGEGAYSWINENCDKYGFIVRYTQEKSHITGYQDESWHFRYVGKPHAELMKSKNLCLEEYMSFIKDFTQHSPCEFTDSNNQKYLIYFQPKELDSSITAVYIPEGTTSYTISGNNIDGFIVTVLSNN